MRIPLSPTFDRVLLPQYVNGCPQPAVTEWALPYPGLLSHDTDYYWRVRARNDQGTWGPWSETWRFRCRTPHPPVELEFKENKATGTYVLTWKPNPTGARPVRYRVYGSDEMGFPASAGGYERDIGSGFITRIEEMNKTTPCGVVKVDPNLAAEAIISAFDT